MTERDEASTPTRVGLGAGLGGVVPERAIAGMPRTEYLLRRLLAHRVAGAGGYFDDGELQDNSRLPFIDFLRDHPKDIELKLIERLKTPNVAGEAGA